MKRITIAICMAVMSLPSYAAPAFSVGFSPSHSGKSAILEVIGQASETLSVEAYDFTDKDIANALLSAQRRGVSVRVIADQKANSDKYTKAAWMASKGIAVRLNGKYAIFHNKIILADGKTLQTGSYNYTSSADIRNAENVLVVWNQPQLVSVYQQEFERLWQESLPFSPLN